MVDFRTSTEQVSGVSGSLASHAAEFSSRLEQTKAIVEGVVGGSWNSAGAQEFKEAVSRWVAEATIVQESLTSVSQNLGTAAGVYEVSEAKIKQGSDQALASAGLGNSSTKGKGS